MCVRLLLMFMLAALVAVGAVAIFANQATGGAFQHYIKHQTNGDEQLISQIILQDMGGNLLVLRPVLFDVYQFAFCS